MSVIGLIISVVILILIFLLSRLRLFLLTAFISNIPLLSLFAYSQSKTPRQTALYLVLFPLTISISFLIVYLLGGNNKINNMIIALSSWLILSAFVFILFSRVKLWCLSGYYPAYPFRQIYYLRHLSIFV